MTTSLTTFSFSYSSTDYLLALPMLLLTVFALGILMIDLMLPPQWKRLYACSAAPIRRRRKYSCCPMAAITS